MHCSQITLVFLLVVNAVVASVLTASELRENKYLRLLNNEGANSSSISYRLPPVSEPMYYDLYLDMTDTSFTSYSGTVDITIKYTGNEASFALNSVDLEINQTSVRVMRADGTEVPLKSFTISQQYQQLYFEFDEKLETDASYKVHIEFIGQIKTDFFKGIYRSSYRVGGEIKYLVTTFLAATYARTVFPCYDEPAYKARFNVKIRHRSHHTALSNMPVTNSLQLDGYSETTFDTTPLMSTYLVAFVVSEMKTLSSDQELFRVFAPENKVNDTIYAHDFAVRAVRALENHFGRQNQMPKIDLVGIPDFAMGAMENWGLITFREDYLIYEGEEETMASAKQRIASVITHELVHMWFGNEVTPEWWTYVWLNEGFANYFEFYITSQLEPSWKFWEQFILSEVHSALSKDCYSSARQMNYFATDPAILNELYDYVVYAKSASVIRMIQNVIGFDTFRQAINDYLRSRSYLTTKPEYLYTSIEKFRTVDLPGSVEAIFESWANAPGYPVVTVTIDRTQRTLTASQKRFWMPNEVDTPPENKLFYIPLNYASSVSSSNSFDDTAPTFWLTPMDPSTTISIESGIEWLVVNKQQTGYYRVNYDEESWHKLIAALNNDRFDELLPVINRAQLIDDVANLARAGEVGYDVALSLMQYLERETEYIPWSTAYNALLYLDRMYSGAIQYERFESFLRSITGCMYENILLTGPMDHISRLHRGNTVYLACFSGVQKCLDDAYALVTKAVQDPTYTIPEEVQPAVFCALHKYPMATLNVQVDLFEKYLQSANDPQQLEMINRFLTSVGCARNETDLEYYLALTTYNYPGLPITADQRNQIYLGLINGSPTTRLAALRYMHEHFSTVTYLLTSVTSIFTELGNRINSRLQHEVLKNIVQKYGATLSTSAKAAADASLIQADQNIQWIEKHSEHITAWLVEKEYEGTTVKPPGGGTAAVHSIGMLVAFGSALILLMSHAIQL